MDIGQLCSILSACTSPNLQQRQAAENTLAQFQHSKGQLVNLLRVAVEPSLDLGTRQAAAISFKNLVRRDWAAESDAASPIPAEDKQSVRDNLLESIIRAPPIVQKQLGECLKDILYNDYPEQWPGLLQSIVQNLNTQEQVRIHGGLFALRILMRKYEFRQDDEDQASRTAVITSTFPLLLHIFQGLMQMEAGAAEVCELLKLACKIFYSATYMGVPALLLQPQQFQGWMAALHTLVLQDTPPGMPEGGLERVAWPWWKTKKWVLHIVARLFNRYSEPQVLEKGSQEQAFAEMWAPQCGVQFLDAIMQLLSRFAQGQYVAPRAMNLCLSFVTHAVQPARTWTVLKPHVPALLQSCIFPLACFDDDDALLWQDDPQEYIRKGYDIMEEMYYQKTAAVNFVQELCKSRSKASLQSVMALAVQVMNEHQAAGANVSQDLARKMDGALLVVGALNTVLMKKAPYKHQLEPMLTTHILPTFASPYGHLRAKASWVAGQYAGVPFREGRGQGATFLALFQHVAEALRDSDLPVQVDSVVALRYLIDAFDADDLPKVKAVLPQLLEEIFKLMNKYMEIEDLVSTLESIVERFGEDIAPFAVTLCQQLVFAFWRMQVQEEGGEDDEEEDSALAAFGILRALSTVMEGVSTLPGMFPQLEAIIFPILKAMTSQQGQDVFEEIMELISYFTYFPPQISPQMWSLWPQIYGCYLEWAQDYFENIMVPLDNFISHGTEVFLSGQNPNYLDQANKMVGKALMDPEAAEGDVSVAPRLLEVIMQRCRGRVDYCIPLYLNVALERLKTAQRAQLRTALVAVVANAFYYNAVLSMNHLQQQLPSFFQLWSEIIHAKGPQDKSRHLTRPYDKKLHIVALCEVMAVPEESMPAPIRPGLPHLLSAAMQLLLALKQQQESEEHLHADGGDVEPGDDLGNGYADDQEGDEVEEEGDSHLLSRLAESARHYKDSDDDSDQDWTDEEDDEADGMPLDEVDAFEYFANSLRSIRASQPQRFQSLTASCDANVQASLQGMMKYVGDAHVQPAAPG